MPEFFKKIFSNFREIWKKWSAVQKGVVIAISLAAVAGIVSLVTVSSKPSAVPIFDTPVASEDLREQIITRINEEGVKTQVSSAGLITVDDEKTARKMRSILIREDLVPAGISPWAVFDTESWTITDFERNVKLQRSITSLVKEHIKALDEVDDAKVSIVFPKDSLFTADQKPVTASVTLFPRPGSDLTENRKKIEGIQKILTRAVEGLTDENITITDSHGLVLNDFEGMKEADRLALIDKQTKLISKLENDYAAKSLKSLQSIFGADRVRSLNVKIDMDMSEKKVEGTKVNPIIIKPRTPGLSYDDSEIVNSVTLSESTSTTTWKGTGFNPEGPAGVEGQTPPAYKDMSNLAGEMTQETKTHNEELSKENYEEVRSPEMGRRTVSVNIDGVWQVKRDEKGKKLKNVDGGLEREYIALTSEEIAQAASLIKGAIGFDASRGDTVEVTNLQFDRRAEFLAEDTALIKAAQLRMTLIAILGGLVLLLIAFVLYQSISRAREAARRQRELDAAEELRRQREEAILAAEGGEADVPISVEDQGRKELMNTVIAMAREHPADAGKLISTWLRED